MHNHIQHKHVDINLQGEQAAGANTANVSHIRQTSMTWLTDIVLPLFWLFSYTAK